MAYKILKLEKIDDNQTKDFSSMNFTNGGMVTTFYTERGTFVFQWDGVIGTQSGSYLDGRHIADIYEEYVKNS